MIKRFLGNMSISALLTSALVTIGIAFLVSTGLGITGAKTANQTIDMMDINRQQLSDINRADVLRLQAHWHLKEASEALSSGLYSLAEERLKEADDLLARAHERFNAFLALPVSAKTERYIEPVETSFAKVLDMLAQQSQALVNDDLAGYNAFKAELDKLDAQLNPAMTALVQHASKLGQSSMASFQAFSQVAGVAGMVMNGFILVLLVVARFGLVNIVVRPLKQAVEHFGHIADADLSRTIQVHSRNEIGQLFAAMRDMQNGLSSMVSTVRESSGSIHVGTREIASGNADLSSRTEQQASSIEETAASMVQLTAAVKQNAANARQASTLANDASSTAGHGGEVVERVINTMHGISDSSKKISDITGVIDSIAFQTNILALNASVEAARAGVQGRGFAVVAGEVRSLASRSAGAAKEIKALIDGSVSQIQQGSTLVEEAGATMRDIVASIRRVNDIMEEISSASQDQSDGIEQVNNAVTKMDEVIQQNAALVQQAATAAASLEEQASCLEHAVVVFRLADQDVDEAVVTLPSSKPSGKALSSEPSVGEPAIARASSC